MAVAGNLSASISVVVGWWSDGLLQFNKHLIVIIGSIVLNKKSSCLMTGGFSYS